MRLTPDSRYPRLEQQVFQLTLVATRSLDRPCRRRNQRGRAEHQRQGWNDLRLAATWRERLASRGISRGPRQCHDGGRSVLLDTGVGHHGAARLELESSSRQSFVRSGLFCLGVTPNATMARPTSSSRPSMERARTPAATSRRRSDVPPVPRRRHGTTGTTVYGYLLPESSSSFISCSMRAAESQSPLSRACRSCARRA